MLPTQWYYSLLILIFNCRRNVDISQNEILTIFYSQKAMHPLSIIQRSREYVSLESIGFCKLKYSHSFGAS